MTEVTTPQTSSGPLSSLKHPSDRWVEGFLAPSLVQAKGYRLDVSDAAVKLDQNECPWDLPADLKQKICARLALTPWNRYPSAYSDHLASRLAQHVGVPSSWILLGPGSNYLLSLILNTFTKHLTNSPLKNGGSLQTPGLKIARPSFPHYEAHCLYEGIPFEPWLLTQELEYDLPALDGLADGSVVIFASPNNPVGNSLSSDQLAQLLSRHPQSLFIADEAYFEYLPENYGPLLASYSNLILVRTFSKTLAAAGVRIGYVVGSPIYLDQLRKVRPPFLLNAFQNICLDELLGNPATEKHIARVVAHTNAEKQKLTQWFESNGPAKGFTAKESQANFFLLRWADPAKAQDAYQHLLKSGIQVRNVSQGPGLAGCLRVTIGTQSENQAFCTALVQGQA